METIALLPPSGPAPRFDVGDVLVHPHQGVGRVISNQHRKLAGGERSYLEIEFADRALKILLPCESTATIGLRPPASRADALDVAAVLQAQPAVFPANWTARERHYRERLKGASVLELAAVVRDLAARAATANLAAREQDLHDRARTQLTAELAHALGLNPAQAAAHVDEHIARVADRTAHASCGH
jgi:RNA polymerase-interacting CarD/CdnL/TRCF family regulator